MDDGDSDVAGAEGSEVDDTADNSRDVMLLLGQFRDIAAHPKSRNQLIQDATSLGGLVLLLNDKNRLIVEHTLEIFLLLSKSKVRLGRCRCFILCPFFHLCLAE